MAFKPNACSSKLLISSSGYELSLSYFSSSYKIYSLSTPIFSFSPFDQYFMKHFSIFLTSSLISLGYSGLQMYRSCQQGF
ncbi:hypothetical protein FGO68_gene8098 [Halteria grandinella]|uniref:Uncharacterized protein n=1 Tax=Halteria grandinella TaxID=5974 RepID=A0A8J8NC64_HALGN|nr:hypothetical protein FGO68_gene8098 [Halteria grandinella]